MPSSMTKHENIAKTLKARLSELTGRVAEIDSELCKPLSADLEEQATDVEDHDTLKAIENSEIHEIHQIQEALKRISEGTYGICSQWRGAVQRYQREWSTRPLDDRRDGRWHT
jgi:DnaK suppressor protein